MAVRRKPPQGSGKIYLHFAAIALVGAGIVALASLDGKSPVAAAKAEAKPAPFKASLTTKAPSRVFDMGEGAIVPAGETPALASRAAAPLITTNTSPAPAQALQEAPPPGDPAKLVGQRYPSAAASAPAQPTPEQAARLLADSRARSGAVNQGD